MPTTLVENPKADEFIIDTASGSAGFPVHSIFKVWRDIFRAEGLKETDLFTTEKKPQPCYDYVGEKVFAIDFDEKVVRVADARKTHNELAIQS